MKTKPWLLFALITTLCWGVWGALIETPGKAGFPATLGYIVWAFTTVPCAAIALHLSGWRLDRHRRALLFGSAVGLLGSGGQIALFLTLRTAPAYLVFPIVSLYPVVTILLSLLVLKERASRRAWCGIALALAAIPLLARQQPASGQSTGWSWVAGPIAVFLAWGVQGYFMKSATGFMSVESIYFYMSAAGLCLMPAAWLLADFSHPVNWGWRGPGLAACIQILNAIGSLMLVFAMRYGKAIIVVPVTSLAPVLTILLSLLLYGVVPSPVLITGMVMAAAAILLMAE
ncbi:EamA family transporter [Paludibaculum fermentans]|uniref:EamA family transporter n=1 Tax=Paludibaculum fermentans TaxID=1473598 RepID=UPI003EBBC3E4